MSGALNKLLPEGQDLAGLLMAPFPVSNCGMCFGRSHEEHCERHNNLKAVSDDDMHLAVPDLVVGNVPHINWKRINWSHVRLLRPSRGAVQTITCISFKALTSSGNGTRRLSTTARRKSPSVRSGAGRRPHCSAPSLKGVIASIAKPHLSPTTVDNPPSQLERCRYA